MPFFPNHDILTLEVVKYQIIGGVMAVKDIFNSFVDKLSMAANVSIVFGEPIVTKTKTIIPIAKTQYGFGAGGASLSLNTENNDNSDAGGGGGGVKTVPVGVLEVSEEKTRFIPTISIGDILLAFGMILTFIYRMKKLKKL